MGTEGNASECQHNLLSRPTMRSATPLAVLVVTVRLTAAFPGGMNAASEHCPFHMFDYISLSQSEQAVPVEERGVFGDAVGDLGGFLNGLLGSIAQNVNPSDKRPDAAHPFVTPGINEGPVRPGVCSHYHSQQDGATAHDHSVLF